jgi:hypothetical protein
MPISSCGMKMLRTLRIITAITVLVFLQGCNTAGIKAIVSKDRIENPGIGFRGYECEIPKGYEPIDKIVSTDESEIAFLIRVDDWFGSIEFPESVRDLVLLCNVEDESVILFRVDELIVSNTLNQLYKEDFRDVIQALDAKNFNNYEGSWEEGNYTGEASYLFSGVIREGLNENAASISFIFGKLNEIISIWGESLEASPEKLKDDVDWMSKSIIIK